MESNTNPFASPTANDDLSGLPLILEFRPNRAAFLIAVPFMVFCAAISVAAATGATSPHIEFQESAYRALIAITAAIGAYGCATVFWCKITANKKAIVRHDFLRRVVPLNQIETWWLQPFPNAVFIQISGKRKPLPLHNWAMSNQSRNAIAELLRDKVGPPKYNGR